MCIYTYTARSRARSLSLYTVYIYTLPAAGDVRAAPHPWTQGAHAGSLAPHPWTQGAHAVSLSTGLPLAAPAGVVSLEAVLSPLEAGAHAAPLSTSTPPLAASPLLEAVLSPLEAVLSPLCICRALSPSKPPAASPTSCSLSLRSCSLSPSKPPAASPKPHTPTPTYQPNTCTHQQAQIIRRNSGRIH